MKQIILLILFVWIGFTASAKLVEANQIKHFAEQFLLAEQRDNYSILSIEEIQTDDELTSYFIQLKPKGFLLISADDKVEPLLAYSFESTASAQQDWPDQLTWWVKESGKSIKQSIKDKKLKKNAAWDTDYSLKSACSTTVSPLIQVRWDQGKNWNQFCPEDEDGPGGRVWVGCVAVSMAQAMSKYKYPTIGQGKASYIHSTYGTQMVNFDKEEPYQWDSMGVSSANIYNARLLYHCAVTVNMDFGADGSGAYTKTASSALKNYFNYSETTHSVNRIDDDDEWKTMLVENLQNGYPLIYNGDGDNGEAGHAWNIDGVDAQGLFHVNWGWSGSMNGYYNINNLAPGANDFTKNQGAILGIKPKKPGPVDISLDNLAVKEKQPAGTFVSMVHVEDEFPENPYSYNLKGSVNVLLGGYTEPKFYIENDSLKTIEEFDYEKRTKYTLFIEAVDTLGNSLEKMFEIQVLSTVDVPEISASSSLHIYPNPFTSVLTVENETETQLSVFNTLGAKVFNTVVPTGKHELNLSQLKTGLYIVEAKNKNGTYYRKLQKK